MKQLIMLSLLTLFVGADVGCTNKNSTKENDKGTDTPIPPAVAKSETAEEALKGLAGTWKISSMQNLPPYVNDEVKKSTAQIEGNKIKLSSPFGYFDRGEIHLDPTKSPKQFDLIALDESGKPQTIEFFISGGPDGGKKLVRPVETVQGIYSLKGDQLIVAITDRESFRPTDFKPAVMENTGGLVTVDKLGPTYITILELNRVK